MSRNSHGPLTTRKLHRRVTPRAIRMTKSQARMKGMALILCLIGKDVDDAPRTHANGR